MDGALSSGKRAGGQYLLSQQVGNAGEPKMLQYICWQLSPVTSLCALPVNQPTQPRSSVKLCCLTGRGRHSQLSWTHFSSNRKVPAGAIPKSSFPTGVQAHHCATHSASKPHKSTAQPINTLQHCHCCKADRGYAQTQQSQQMPLLRTKRWLKQTADAADTDNS